MDGHLPRGPGRLVPDRRGLQVAAAIVALSQLEVWKYGTAGGGAAAAVTLGAVGAGLAWCRRMPVLSVLLVQAALFACSQFAGQPFSATSVVASWVSFFCVGAMHNRVLSVVTLATFMVVAVAETTPLTLNGYLSVSLTSFALPWLLGLLWHSRVVRRDEAERQERAAADAVAAERLRLARDLHDVVSHNVGMIAVQAGAADVVLDEQPGRAHESLAAIEEGARATLLELRRMLGLLRDDDPDPLTRPPSLAELGRLVAPLADAGVVAHVTVEGERRPLDAEVEAAAYRVLQEALTNVVVHAAPCGTQVRVSYRAEGVALEVLDDGAPRDGTSRGGYGLVGARERISALDGVFEAGPRESGGFRVYAEIPVLP